MSYFDLPRLHVSGRFFADPSSANNDPKHYLPETKTPSPWQMPKGQHFFKFHDCRIMSAHDVQNQPSEDGSIIGAAFASIDTPIPGKIVDIDVYQQAVSTLYGVGILIGDANGAHIKGKMGAAVLNGNSFSFVQPTRGWEMQYGWGSYGGDSNAIGGFQTVIRVAEADWKCPAGSLLDALKQRCIAETLDGVTFYLVAFKFLLDGYWNVAGSSDYQNGRMTGTLGPLLPGDPQETPGARWLEARPLPKGAAWYVPFFYRAPFKVSRETSSLLLDWSGSVSRLSVGGDPCPLGTVTAVAMTASGPEKLGPLTIDAVSYRMAGGMSELKLNAAQLDLLEQSPLQLWTSREDIGPQCLFSERPDGLACCTQGRAIRMTPEPGSPLNTVTCTAHITQFGKSKSGVTPSIRILPVTGTTPGATVPPDNPGDTWQADGALVATAAPSDVHGFSKITFNVVRDPGSRTTELDGQMYFAYVYPDAFKDDEVKPWEEPRQEQQISVLAWSRYEVIEHPGWPEIQRLMAPYAKLYPGMTEKFDLASKAAFDFYSNNPDYSFFLVKDPDKFIPGHPKIHYGTIPYYISLPIDDPRFMPVSRDLSPNKISTILNYIEDEQLAILAKGGKVDGGKPPITDREGTTS